jgi:hypothetical protein
MPWIGFDYRWTRREAATTSLINGALRQHIRRTKEPLEATLRRVIREELIHAS